MAQRISPREILNNDCISYDIHCAGQELSSWYMPIFCQVLGSTGPVLYARESAFTGRCMVRSLTCLNHDYILQRNELRTRSFSEQAFGCSTGNCDLVNANMIQSWRVKISFTLMIRICFISIIIACHHY